MANNINSIILISILVLCSCGRESGRKRPHKSNMVTTNSTKNHMKRNDVKVTPNTSSKAIMTPMEIFERFNSAVFMVYSSDGDTQTQGSGFFISRDGLALSNHHVFNGADMGNEIIKLVNDQQFRILEVIDYDEDLDYVLFRVDIGTDKVNYIPISDKVIKVGEKVYAIGSPLGLENTFSSGEVSQIRDNYLLQISVPIDHGSSGGALIDSYGKAIGITTSRMSESNANLNFATSVNVITVK